MPQGIEYNKITDLSSTGEIPWKGSVLLADVDINIDVFQFAQSDSAENVGSREALQLDPGVAGDPDISQAKIMSLPNRSPSRLGDSCVPPAEVHKQLNLTTVG